MPLTFEDALKKDDFYKLAPAEQRKVLGGLNNDFAGLPEKEQSKVIGKYHLNYLNSSDFQQAHPGSARAMQPPSSGIGEFASTIGNDIASIPGAVYQTARHPIQAGKGMIDAQVAQGQESAQAFKEGRYSEAFGHGAAALLPIVGPAAAQAGEEIGQGEYAKGLAHATELLAPELGRPLITKGLRKGAGVISKGLERSAEEEYAGVLHPSGKADKFVTQNKLLNQSGKDLLNRRVMGTTAKGLRNKLLTNARDAAQKINATFNNLPPTAQVNIRPILRTVRDRAMQEATEEVGPGQLATPGMGNRRIVNPELWNSYLDIQNDIVDRLGSVTGQVSPKSLRAVRRIYDGVVKDSFKGKEISTIKQTVHRSAADAIREELNSQLPDVGKINAEYSFWRNAADVMTNTTLRKVGQRKFLNRVARIAPDIAMSGIGYKEFGALGGAAGVLIGDYMGRQLQEIFGSTAWHTVKAVTKNEVAKALASGKGDLALRIASRAVGKGAQATLPRSYTGGKRELSYENR